jgi:oligoribonuclease
MSNSKNEHPTKLFWVDLEMTGLNSHEDLILEIAAIVTDFDFKELARYEARVHHDPLLVAERMQRNPWWETVPENRDEFLGRVHEGQEPNEVEQELVAFLDEQFGEDQIILAGNSIHQDRKFIAHWWPKLNAKLHYRMLDVSALKVYMQGKYGLEFEKKSTHRALDDIKESMLEWQFYMDRLRGSKD